MYHNFIEDAAAAKEEKEDLKESLEKKEDHDSSTSASSSKETDIVDSISQFFKDKLGIGGDKVDKVWKNCDRVGTNN